VIADKYVFLEGVMNDTKEREVVYTRSEAAQYLRLCRQSFDRLRVPRVKAGRRVLYTQSGLEKWLADNTAAPAGEGGNE
jgi:hypothetical protein